MIHDNAWTTYSDKELAEVEKLSKDYFDRLTYSIGKSERMRTLKISKRKYMQRVGFEVIKWRALVLAVGFALRGQFTKSCKLLAFRWNVSRGLLSRKKAIFAGPTKVQKMSHLTTEQRCEISVYLKMGHSQKLERTNR